MVVKNLTYAIVEISGKQFWLEPESYYEFNRIPIQVGDKIILNRVLLAYGPERFRVLIGCPYLENIQVHGKILKHLRGKKTIIYKMRSKKKTRRKQGHRQELTRVLIEKIQLTT